MLRSVPASQAQSTGQQFGINLLLYHLPVQIPLERPIPVTSVAPPGELC